VSFASTFLWRSAWDELADDGQEPEVESHCFARAYIGFRRRRTLRREITRLLEQPGGHESVIYFMRVGRHVKIGRTTNLRKRMLSFYLGPDDILAIVPGAKQMEDAYHARFARTRFTRDGRAELFHLDWRLWLYLSRRRVDVWDVVNSYGAALVVVCTFFWIGQVSLLLALLAFTGSLGFQFFRPGWNYAFLPPVRQVLKGAAIAPVTHQRKK
jgi:hypothetical protein